MSLRRSIPRLITVATSAAFTAPSYVLAQGSDTQETWPLPLTHEHHAGKWITLGGFALATAVVFYLKRTRRRRR